MEVARTKAAVRSIEEVEPREHGNRLEMMGERRREPKTTSRLLAEATEGTVVLFLRWGTRRRTNLGCENTQQTQVQAWRDSFIQ